MSTEPKQNATKLTLCPTCSAAVAVCDPKCWLCGCDRTQEIVTATVIGEPPSGISPLPILIAFVVALFVLCAATLAEFALAPGVGILLGFVAIVAVFGVSKVLSDPSPVAPASFEDRAIVAAYSAPRTDAPAAAAVSVVAVIFKVIGIILLVAVAAVIAFGAFCAICIAVVVGSH